VRAGCSVLDQNGLYCAYSVVLTTPCFPNLRINSDLTSCSNSSLSGPVIDLVGCQL
jgi:hypothetical protein